MQNNWIVRSIRSQNKTRDTAGYKSLRPLCRSSGRECGLRLLGPTVAVNNYRFQPCASATAHCKAYNVLMTSQVDSHLLPHATHISEAALFRIREMNPFADDLHKHLSVLCLPLIPNEFLALTVFFFCCSLPHQMPFPDTGSRFCLTFFLKLHLEGSGAIHPSVHLISF